MGCERRNSLKRCDDRPLVDLKRSGQRLQRLNRNILELCLSKTLDRLAEHTPQKLGVKKYGEEVSSEEEDDGRRIRRKKERGRRVGRNGRKMKMRDMGLVQILWAEVGKHY